MTELPFSVEQFEELRVESIKDIEIDEMDIEGEAVRTPKLFSKYFPIFQDCAVAYKKMKIELDALEKHLYLFYTGRASPAVYKERKRPNFEVTKTETPLLIKGDEMYIKLTMRMEQCKIMCDFFEAVIKQIKDRNYHLKLILDYRKFSEGNY